MKNTCTIRVHSDGFARFYPNSDPRSTARVANWPRPLAQKVRSPGVYAFRRMERPTPKSVTMTIVGTDAGAHDSYVGAFFLATDYELCMRFLHELGVKPPRTGKLRTLHLTVTKRKP